MKNKFFKYILLFLYSALLINSTITFAQESEASVRPPFPPANLIVGVNPGVLVYSGDVDEALNNLSVELFTRIMYPESEDFSLYVGLGYSKLEGNDYDANTPPRSFRSRNPFTYGVVMPGYKVNANEKIILWLKAGLGFGYLKAVNPATQGGKILVPLGIEMNYRFTQSWVFTTNINYTFAGELDGLRRGDNPDYRESDQLIGITIGLGFIP